MIFPFFVLDHLSLELPFLLQNLSIRDSQARRSTLYKRAVLDVNIATKTKNGAPVKHQCRMTRKVHNRRLQCQLKVDSHTPNVLLEFHQSAKR